VAFKTAVSFRGGGVEQPPIFLFLAAGVGLHLKWNQGILPGGFAVRQEIVTFGEERADNRQQLCFFFIHGGGWKG
jgi:hypothetical protein